MLKKRSPYSVSAVLDFLLGIWAAIASFFTTMTSPQAQEQFLRSRKQQRVEPRTTGGGGKPRIAGLSDIQGSSTSAPAPGCGGGG